MKIYYLLFLLLFFFACGKKSASTSPEPTSNAVYISGFKDDEYRVAQNGKIIITPIIKRENDQTEAGLEFEWVIDGNVVSKERNLEINIPYHISNGRKVCSYTVVDKKYDKSFREEFSILITNPFGYGYYFLSVDASFSSLLSHININKDSETIFHTSVIGSVSIGDNANSLHSLALFDEKAEHIYHKIFITSRYGEVPYIVTDNLSLVPLEMIHATQGGGVFLPMKHFFGYRGESTSHFLSDGAYVFYKDGLLKPDLVNGGKYKWGHIVAGNNDETVYAYSTLSGKFYAIASNRNYEITAVEGDVTLFGETILGSCLMNVYGENGIAENVSILTSKAGVIMQYDIIDQSIRRNWIGAIEGTAECCVATGEEGCWYVAAGNLIYRVDVGKNSVSQCAVLDRAIGAVNCIALSATGDQLVVTTFNNQSLHAAKGSVVIIDLVSKKITPYYNTIYNCVGIACCDSKSW